MSTETLREEILADRAKEKAAHAASWERIFEAQSAVLGRCTFLLSGTYIRDDRFRDAMLDVTEAYKRLEQALQR